MTRRRRPTGTRSAPWWKVARLLIVAALLALPIAMGAGTVVATSAAADAPAVTVPGPTVNPGSTVTVEKTEDLVNEVVRVRWTGFTPSVYHLTTPGQFSEGNTRYPVRVYQCRGTDPDRPGQCYGSQIYEYPGRTDLFPNYFLGIPDGPQNYVQTATAADGTGSVDLEVRTIIESSTLGCTAASACSIVVVPNYGHPTERDPSYPQFPACATIFDFQSLRTCQGEFGDPDAPYGNSIDATWAWDNRVVVPISFAQTGETCPFGDAQVATIGAPQAARAVASWQPVACTQDAAVDFDYTAQSEVLARNNFLNGLKDIGLTHRPADPDAATDRTYTYAPVTTSAVAIAFRVDDAATFQRIEDMKLSPRLIAKMITQSYGWAGSWFDNPATEGNPQSLFQDPEFLELNPGHTWPSDADSTNATPILMADLSDMTYELTRYLNADADARAFLDGEPDDWDMHVNTYWTDVLYPTETFEARDPNERVISAYQPIQGLRNVAAKLVSNAYPGVSTDLDPSGKNIKFGPGNTGIQPPGSRAFVAIVDTSNAAAFRFPTAQLLNAAGEFVAPTSDAMATGVAAMTVNADGITRTADVSSTDPAAYPLTMIDYAMVPTSGLDDDTAEAAGRLLDYAAGPGQVPGQLFGGLPAGYLPLTADLVAQTETAAAAVRAQAGGPLPTTPPPASSSPPPRSGSSSGPGGGFPPGSPGSSGSSGAVPGGGSAPTGPTQTTGPSAAGSTSPVAAAGAQRPVGSDSPAWIKYVLPVVLAIGLAAALLGTGTSWIVGRGGIAVPAVLLRLPMPAPLRRSLSKTTPGTGDGKSP